MVCKTIAQSTTPSKSKTFKKRPDWKLVRNHLPLLKSIIGKMSSTFPPTVDRENMYAVGLLGLISAGQTYNQHKDAQFGTHAAIRIKGALLDELRHSDYLPRYLRTTVKAVKKMITAYEEEFQCRPSDKVICDYFHLTPQKWNRLKPHLKPRVTLSLNKSLMPNDTTALTLQEQLEDVQQKTARELCEKKELMALLKMHIQFLSEPEQKILDLHYNEGTFLSEIARRMRMGQSKVWQMHAKAIEKIRRRIIKAIGE